MTFCIIIPVYNSPHIRDVVEDVLKYGHQIIVVDDGSSVRVSLDNLDVVLITHKNNMGKGKAILSGALRAKEMGYDGFVTMDADKQHLSSQIQKLICCYEPQTIVIGNRDFSGEHIPASSKFGRKFSNFWVMLETWMKLGDTQSGFRMYPISVADLSFTTQRFDFEIEILVLHVYQGGKICDTDVECYYPPKSERISHFDKLDDNVRISLLHIKLLIQRYLFLRGWLWK